MRKNYLIGIFLLWLCLPGISWSAPTIVWKETTIPMPEAGPRGLQSLLVWPEDGVKHPLALISHGSPRDAKERQKMIPLFYLPLAMEFARRGFSVAVVLRRGYGNSGGGWVEGFGSCQLPDYLHSALTSAMDLRTAIHYLDGLPQFDTTRMIAVGFSAGGLATLALTAVDPPPGLVAAINFAGGRGSRASDTVCKEDKLIATFGILGKTSRIPLLWIYAKNDHFFNPQLASKFLTAFTQNGGKVQFIEAESFQNEGHFLFSTKGIPIWTPMVDHFIKNQHIILTDTLLPYPAYFHLQPPAYLSTKAKQAFLKDYNTAAPHKAFAAAADGAYGWRSGQKTADQAKMGALENCRKHAATLCKVVVVDYK